MLMIIASIMVKKLRLGSGMESLSSATQMKTLATQKLYPKQSITLIEIDKKKILLGVITDGVNFITNIENESSSQRVTAQRVVPK